MPLIKDHLKIFPIVAILLIAACTYKHPIEKPVAKTKATTKQVIVKANWEAFALGDMNHDNLPDTAFVYTPAYYGTPIAEDPKSIDFDSCVGGKNYNKIKFSAGLPPIVLDNTLWGKVEPIGDLDEDGINEFIFQTNWYIGTHVQISIYSFNKEKSKWVVLATNNLYFDDSYKNRITKINKHQFRFKIEYMDTIELHDLAHKEIVVDIKK